MNRADGHGRPMTIGELSRRTGVAVKALRQYEDLRLIYTVGRSQGNYRLFDDEALWCVRVISTLRDLGLTVAEICDLGASYQATSSASIGPALATALAAVRARTEARIDELQARLERITEYEATYAAELSGESDFRATDPHFGTDPRK